MSTAPETARVVRVCKGTGCVMSGSVEVAQAFVDAIAKHAPELAARGADAQVVMTQSGCRGRCEQGPLVTVEPDGILYVHVDPAKAARIVEEHLVGGTPVEDFFSGAPEAPKGRAEEVPFFAKQTKIVLRRCGLVDPEDIEECVRAGAYEGLRKVLTATGDATGAGGGGGMNPDEVIEEVLASGLRGRGGAGFPTGLKWRAAREAPGEKKYLICNGDEGDPGAFMDRSVMEGDPHAVLEGMIIGGYAVGADEGYVYVRAEYPLAVKRLRIAIDQARERGYLGKGVLGSDFDFDLRVKEGAGAFICGEETALMNSIEGKRGMPRVRPPFPAQSGLWGKPTNINNVETWATVGWIITNGAPAYAAIGEGRSLGTKVFAVTGKVKDTGLIEVPMGMTLREVIFDIAGGVKDDRDFRAVQIGGPSGGCLPADRLDLPVEYESLAEAGAIVGSGGLVVLDDTTCMVDLARYFLEFTQSESCGKCVPCRIGTKRMLEILTRITAGEGREADIDELRALAADVKRASLCGLGQTAPNPLLTTLRYFEEEYVEHIRDKHCRAGACAALIELFIDPMVCTMCKACVKVCPVDCVAFDGHILSIEQDKCIKCRSCVAACRFDAIAPRRGGGAPQDEDEGASE